MDLLRKVTTWGARDIMGDYALAFLIAGAMAMAGAMLALRINRRSAPAPIPA